MLTKKYLYLFISLFFLLTFSRANAYTMFSANPYLNDTQLGYPLGLVLYNPIYNNTFYWNATCSGLTNCAIIENNGTSQTNFLYLQQYDWTYIGLIPQWSNYTALFEFYDNNAQNGVKYLEIFLPKNQEGILITNYRWNNSLTTPAPYLAIIDSATGNHLAHINLNTTTNNWYNISYILNASTSDRNLRIVYAWNWDNTPTRLEIDKFKFYTLDIQEVRTGWSNFVDERDRYCGEGSYNYSNNVSLYYKNDYDKGLLFAFDKEDYDCSVFRIGSLTIARRIIEKAGDWGYGCDYNDYLFKYRDPFYLITTLDNCCFCSGMTAESRFLITRFSLTNMALTKFENDTVASCYPNECSWRFVYDYNGKITITNQTDGFINQLAGNISQNINLLPYSNTLTPSGAKWRFSSFINEDETPMTDYYPFFTSQISCEAKTICDIATNFQYFQSATCELLNPSWCGGCYCKSDLSSCNFPSVIGTYCDPTDSSHTTVITDTSTCQRIYNSCPQGSVCSQLTPILTYPNDTILENYTPCGGYPNILGLPTKCVNICWLGDTPLWSNCRPECQHCDLTKMPVSTYDPHQVFLSQKTIFNISSYSTVCIDLTTGTEVISINPQGNQSTITDILNNETGDAYGAGNATTTPPSISTNIFGYTAMAFGGLFGMGDVSFLSVNIAMFAIFLSFLFSTTITMGISFKKAEFAEKIFGYSFLGLLAMFTIGLNNLYLWAIFAVIVIISAGIMSGYFKKVIGGG